MNFRSLECGKTRPSEICLAGKTNRMLELRRGETGLGRMPKLIVIMHRVGYMLREEPTP